MSQLNFVDYPKIHQRTDGKFEIIFRYQDRRFRLQNGKKFGIPLRPNSYPEHERANQAKVLASLIHVKLLNGYSPDNFNIQQEFSSRKDDLYYIKKALEKKLEEGFSKHHQNALKLAYKRIKEHSVDGMVTEHTIDHALSRYLNNTSFNTLRRNMSVLCSMAVRLGMNSNPVISIKKKKEKAKLNRAIKNISPLLEEIKAYNRNLYLCCLITYGCLLRPHREVRELSWGDFNDDLTYIKLSGERNKSGRNRIVPVPKYVRHELYKQSDEVNIFSGKKEPYEADYFKGLWSRFKKKSKYLQPDQTLYSFRHTGAINIYKKSGSLEKLKASMGHSNLLVSLTYLRGLEVSELKEEDMPSFPDNIISM